MSFRFQPRAAGRTSDVLGSVCTPRRGCDRRSGARSGRLGGAVAGEHRECTRRVVQDEHRDSSGHGRPWDSRRFHRRAWRAISASGSGQFDGRFGGSPSGCPLVHCPLLLFCFSSKREQESSSSKSCELWGQPGFGLVGWRGVLLMTTGSDRWMVRAGGGQLGASPECSTDGRSCPHFCPQVWAQLYPTPVGTRASVTFTPIGLWAELWASCDQPP